MQALPLEGMTVLEFTHTIMGPSCGTVLADLGADVIRVEPAPAGDHTRRLTGFASGFYVYFNRNKRAVAIDLKTPEGHAVACDLIRRADALIENFGPGTMERLKLGYDEVHAINPRIVYCALKGFLPGPYAHRPALDEIAQFMAGLSYMTGPPGQPLRAGASVIDIMGGVMGVVAILAALRQRDRDGVGRKVTASLFESAAFLTGQHMAGEAATGEAPPPMPIRRSAWGVYETFDCADDKKLFIGITSDPHWRAFCDAFARPDLLADARFASNTLRVENRAALREIVAALAASRTSEDLAAMLDRAGIPFSPVNTPSDLFHDPQIAVRALPVRMADGHVANFPALPIAIDDETPGLRAQPPALGEHTEAVLRDLGYDDARIAALRASGAIR
ncbi:MAG: CoA transferase [Rhodospirillales bacterium]|nr:CoA transferase [Rhodospirillales bacterium]